MELLVGLARPSGLLNRNPNPRRINVEMRVGRFICADGVG